MNTAKQLDQFYTNPIIAKRFVDKISDFYSISDFDNVIEPSAGSGIIYDCLPKHNRYGVDLDPKHNEIIKDDFFNHAFPVGNNIVIGNPPFGRKGSMAVDFFNRCSKFADVIAFIVPRGFMRVLTQKNLNPEFGLYWSCLLPDDSFIYNDQPYSVRCCAQLWAKEPPSFGKGGYDSWTNPPKNRTLRDIDDYNLKHNCYEKPSSLF